MNILFLIISLIVGVIIFGVPIWNLARLYGSKHPLWMITPPVFFISFFALARVFEEQALVGLFKFFSAISFYWLVLGMALFGFSIILFLIQKTFKISNHKIFWVTLGATVLFGAVATINGQRVVIKDLTLPADYITRSYEFVQISDIQHGVTNPAHMQRIVDRINEVDPEFIVITGDFIDEFYVEPKDINVFNQLTMPIFLITGNHEYYLPAGTIEHVISESTIQLIDGMKIQYEELDIIGVNELETIDGTVDDVGGIDQDRYSIILDHQPITEEVYRAQNRGAELMLSGHTHNGQIWPMGLLVSFRYPFVNGLYSIQDMYLYVTQGTGTVGPLLRLGTVNEVTHITLEPKDSNL